MSRYRPPQKAGAPYITPTGFDALKKELDQLWKVERPQVTATVSWAAGNGDRSENGDYIYGKQRLREIDRRVRYLQKRLEILVVVDKPPSNKNKVYFGAHVTLEKEDGQTVQYQLVGPDEFDLTKAKISIDSPLARALLGKQLDDEVRLPVADKAIYWIIEIKYS
jgi:transcription elongation factor GreB